MIFANHILGHISVTNGQKPGQIKHRVAWVKAYKCKVSRTSLVGSLNSRIHGTALVQICSGITRGRLLNGELHTQRSHS